MTITNKDFCHLHLHNEYSVLDGFGTADKYAAAAKKKGFEYLALTNHGNTDGLLDFQKACDKHGIKPIMGCELYICKDALEKTKQSKGYFHITALVKNDTGWINLNKMLTFGHTVGFYYRPRISYKLLLKHAEGLVFLSGCAQSLLNKKTGLKFLLKLAAKTDVYLEVMPHNIPEQKKINRIARKYCATYPLKGIAATNDCHYINVKDYQSQDVLLAIQTKSKMDDEDRWKFSIKGLHLRSAKQMIKAFKKQNVLDTLAQEVSLLNTIQIANDCCGFRIKEREIHLPHPPALKGKDDDKFLWSLCVKGYRARFGKSITTNKKYLKRLRSEYRIIKDKKFSRYFLIVWDLIRYCEENNIMVGPGRGSVGGSLLAYLIGITKLDPIKFDLLFSRFIDVNRIDYPDIDVDFEDSKRDIVINRLQEIYGENRVAGVTAFSRMKARNVLRDVGRAFKVPYKDVDEVAKLVTDDLKELFESEDIAKQFKREYPDVAHHALQLEGQIRGYNQHAAAIIISQDDLTNGSRCYLADRKNSRVINWEKDTAEHLGLMKLDILALNTLTQLNAAKNLIKENHGVDIVFEDIPLNDPKVLEMIGNGNTVGCFQIGTPAMTKLVQEMGIKKFSHIADAVALVRPGPKNSGMTSQYIERRFGRRWSKKNKVYENITKDTYGVIVYQEQVMAVINKVAGLPYSTADKIRKIIGKKRDVEEFKQYKEKFVKGCLKKKTMSRREANDFWAGLEKHAQYSFNKSHSYGYSLIAYWTAYCKYYYPTEFICASLSHLSTGKEKQKPELVEEARRLGLSVVLPKIGISHPTQWTAKKDKLYVPFIEVKGIGLVTAEKLRVKVKAKKNKFFSVGGIEADIKVNKAVKAILEKINAYEPDDISMPKQAQEYFGFELTNDPYYQYPNLLKFINSKEGVIDRITGKAGFAFFKPDFQDIVSGIVYVPGIIKKRRYRNKALLRCTKCKLIKECSAPVMPSKGTYNVAIIGEAPGKNEDEEGVGFVGRVSELLWSTMDDYKLKREMFHITNTVKCYPRLTRTPKKKEIFICGDKWLSRELKKLDCHLIFAMGNVALQYFTGRSGGITRVNGKTEWIENINAWVCWGVHPSYAIRNPDNEPDFVAGVDNFAKTFTMFKKGYKNH